MTLTETNIAAAFAAHRAEMIAEYDRFIRGQLATLIRTYGPTVGEISRAHSSNRYCNALRQVRSHLVTHSTSFAENRKGLALIDDAKMAKMADRYAKDTVDCLVAKVLSKVGDLDDGATLNRVSGATFRLTGTRLGKTVRIDQNRILNISKLGKLFHQWPARITVDGAKMSAAAFARMAA